MINNEEMEILKEIHGEYLRYTRKKAVFIISLPILLAVLVILSASLGSASLKVTEVFNALFSITSADSYSSDLAQVIVWKLRLPRITMGIIVGMGLGIAGALMQGILKNPLASPYTLGIASAAGFGAALAIVMGIGFCSSREVAIICNAFIFALLSAMVIFALGKLKNTSRETLVLAGVAMMFLFSAMMSILQYLGTTEDVTAVVFWLMGNLSKADWSEVGMAAVILIVSIPLMMRCAWDLNVLATSDETAKGLGVEVEKVRLGGLILASLVTAGSICFVGTIGFIGLVSPHIARMILGGDYRYLLPASGLIGAVLLLAADTAARTILSPMVLPVGILTSFMGVPLFLYLIVKKRREYW